MKPSTLPDAIRLQFDYLMKCTIDSITKNYHRDMKNRSKHEIPFADLSETNLNRISVTDEYEVESICFEVEGVAAVNIHNKELANALKELQGKKRDIVLMFYCLEASDKEIADALKINPSTSYRNRKNALEQIRKFLQEA